MFRYISAVSNDSSRLDVLSGITFLSLSDMSLMTEVPYLIYSHCTSVPLSLENFPFVLISIFPSSFFSPFLRALFYRCLKFFSLYP